MQWPSSCDRPLRSCRKRGPHTLSHSLRSSDGDELLHHISGHYSWMPGSKCRVIGSMNSRPPDSAGRCCPPNPGPHRLHQCWSWHFTIFPARAVLLRVLGPNPLLDCERAKRLPISGRSAHIERREQGIVERFGVLEHARPCRVLNRLGMPRTGVMTSWQSHWT